MYPLPMKDDPPPRVIALPMAPPIRSNWASWLPAGSERDDKVTTPATTSAEASGTIDSIVNPVSDSMLQNVSTEMVFLRFITNWPTSDQLLQRDTDGFSSISSVSSVSIVSIVSIVSLINETHIPGPLSATRDVFN